MAGNTKKTAAAAPEPDETADQGPGGETPDHARAAEKRKAAMAVAPKNAGMIAALEAERHGYVTRGLDDRVAEVDKSLAFYRGE